MRVLFLDCDGVVAPFSSTSRTRDDALQGHLVQRVAAFTRRHDLTVCLSSSWRVEIGVPETVALLERHGWPDAPSRIRHSTPVLLDATRGEEIAAWLVAHPVEAFVILDDADAMAPVEAQHVAIDSHVGVRAADLRRAAAILRRQGLEARDWRAIGAEE